MIDGHRLIVGHAWKFKSNVCLPLLCTVQPLAVKETWDRLFFFSIHVSLNKRGHSLLASIKSCYTKKRLRTRVLTMVEAFLRSVARCFEILPDVFV